MTTMILLAGGIGSRYSSDKPKQLAMLGGKTVLEHTITNIVACPDISRLIVVCEKTTIKTAEEIVARMENMPCVILEGGNTRLESSNIGIQAIDDGDDHKVLLHDAVRPFVPHEVISNCIESLDDFSAVDVCVPSSDTVVRVDEDATHLEAIPNRKYYYRGQTPQGFNLGKLRQAFERQLVEQVDNFTDDCGMFMWAFPDEKVGLVYGTESNIKITYPIDLFIAEQLIISGQTGVQGPSKVGTLDGLNVVLFGGTSGLGKDADRLLSEGGAKTLSVSRRNGYNVEKYEDVERALTNATEKMGQIHAVLNFSGILHVGKLAEFPQEQLESIVQTNYVGSLNIARASYPYLKETKGQLILLSSSSYSKGRSDYSIYSSSKAAIVNLTQALSEEWQADGIIVNCIVPRRADTPMRHAAFPGENPDTLLKPEKVSEKIKELLLSDYSGLISSVY